MRTARTARRVRGPVLQPWRGLRPSAGIGQPEDELLPSLPEQASELGPGQPGDGTSEAVGIEGEGMDPRTRLPGRPSPPGRGGAGPFTVLRPQGQTVLVGQPRSVEGDHRCIVPRPGDGAQFPASLHGGKGQPRITDDDLFPPVPHRSPNRREVGVDRPGHRHGAVMVALHGGDLGDQARPDAWSRFRWAQLATNPGAASRSLLSPLQPRSVNTRFSTESLAERTRGMKWSTSVGPRSGCSQ